MRFVIKFNSEPARSRFVNQLTDSLGNSVFVKIKHTRAKTPTLIIDTRRDESIILFDPIENRTITYLAVVYHSGIVSMHMQHSKDGKKK